MEIYLNVYFSFSEKEQKDHVLRYLLEESRPQFEDDVPVTEVSLFELFETTGCGEHIEISELESLCVFEGDEADDMLYRIPKLLSYFNVPLSGAFIGAEDCEREYFVFEGKRYHQVYVAGESEEIDSSLDSMYTKSEVIKFILEKFI
ncbi:hypothetical protein [Pleionea mediterranea]|uniref:Uncharacterized protein n=1 Tax=Pleionea mediterranea TaxID=523701 RepID=A0A316FEP4_9GAMM|nr:hypothetical protein [Pleionea mediterranea]PWK47381.1 hypothetical protein C8D97_111126 [Pleionea mediterranea]